VAQAEQVQAGAAVGVVLEQQPHKQPSEQKTPVVLV